jgi:hypothetical protein
MIADLLPRANNRLAAVAVGIGGMGVYNAISILSGGQLQQAFAVFVALGCLWLAREAPRRPAAILFGIGGFLLSASYPEFLVAVPLYSLVFAIIVGQSLRATATQFGGLIAGFAVQTLLTQGASFWHLVIQSSALPGWAPVPNPPDWPGAVLADIILQTRPPLLTLPLVGLAGIAAWTRWRPSHHSETVPRHAMILLALSSLVWVLALVRTSNLDYAVFKLGGWLGPGIVLLCFWLANALRGQPQRLAQSVAFMFAVARLVSAAYGGNEVLALDRAVTEPQWPREQRPDGGCQVSVETSRVSLTVGAIAGSAAPFHDCSLVPRD